MSNKYEGQSKSSRPELVLFRLNLKYYLILIVARLRTWHAQYDFWAVNILCILAYEQCICQMVSRMLTQNCTQVSENFSNATNVTQQKNLFHNSLFRMKRLSTTSFLSQNNKACNGTNKSVKIVISLHCVTPCFSMSNANNRRPFMARRRNSPTAVMMAVV